MFKVIDPTACEKPYAVGFYEWRQGEEWKRL